jgi:hypothetical protein
VRAQHDSALEAEDEVLAHCLDREELAPVELLRDAQRLCTRVRRRGLDPLSDERLEQARSAVERVALRHGLSLRSGGLPQGA